MVLRPCEKLSPEALLAYAALAVLTASRSIQIKFEVVVFFSPSTIVAVAASTILRNRSLLGLRSPRHLETRMAFVRRRDYCIPLFPGLHVTRVVAMFSHSIDFRDYRSD